MKIAVIGAGYWGPNLVRNCVTNPAVTSTICCDLRAEPLEALASSYPGLITTTDMESLLDDPELTGVMLATPVETHYDIAKEFLERGKHVFIEKPFTRYVWQAQKLIELAEEKELVLMVDHTFIFHPAVQKVKEYLDAGEIGTPTYFESNRTNLGLFQRDVDVIWDLAPHDFSILLHFVDELPTRIQAFGASHFHPNQVDHAHIMCEYESSFRAHFHVSWLSPVKIRQIMLGGDKKMLVYDDLKVLEKIKIYDSGVDVINPADASSRSKRFRYRFGGVHSPVLDNREPLKSALAEFLKSIEEKRQPLTSGVEGLKVMKLLRAAERSLQNGGAAQVVDTSDD